GHGACMLQLPDETGKRWLPFRARPLTLGVRPENVMVGSGSEPTALTMTAVLTERIGSRLSIVFKRESWTLMAECDVRRSASFSVKDGETIPVEVDMANAQLFDGATGLALCHPETG